MKRRDVCAGIAGCLLGAVGSQAQPVLGAPSVEWLRPSGEANAEPLWGQKGGLAVGLWPLSGPRGLLRVYTPYLGQPRLRMVNYISVEPVVNRSRGQSELEKGSRSPHPGLEFWTSDRRKGIEALTGPPPARGRIERRDGAETLTFHLATEPFRNGAQPVIQVLLWADRPHEVGFRLYAAPGSAALDSCVLSATMGNYARLRRVWLSGEVADARKVWPNYRPDRLGFAPWRTWPRERLLKRGDFRIAAAAPDEPDPAAAEYDPTVPPHWRYQGKPATQYWRAEDAKGLVARVNGRSTFWGEQGKIPGGVSYENFEMEVPFQPGQELWFGVTPEPPSALGFNPEWQNNLTGG